MLFNWIERFKTCNGVLILVKYAKLLTGTILFWVEILGFNSKFHNFSKIIKLCVGLLYLLIFQTTNIIWVELERLAQPHILIHILKRRYTSRFTFYWYRAVTYNHHVFLDSLKTVEFLTFGWWSYVTLPMYRTRVY